MAWPPPADQYSRDQGYRQRWSTDHIARVNAWRARWGAPPITTTGAYDPSGVIHDAERDIRAGARGGQAKIAGQALKLFGRVTGNPVLQAAGIAITEAGKWVIKRAAADMEALPAPFAQAQAAELAHAFAARAWIKAQRNVEGSAFWLLIDLPTGTVDDAEEAAPLLHAIYAPITGTAVGQDLMGGPEAGKRAQAQTPAQQAQSPFFDRGPLHARFALLEAAMILSAPMDDAALPPLLRQPLTADEQAALEAQEAPFRARNALHPAASAVLETRPEWQKAQIDARGAWNAQTVGVAPALLGFQTPTPTSQELGAGLAHVKALLEQ